MKLPSETKFTLPGTGVVQRIAAHLIARLPTMAARDQHDARFVSVGSDWPDLDDDMRNIVYISTFKSLHHRGHVWMAYKNHLIISRPGGALNLLPPGVQPVQQNQRNNPPQNQRGDRRNNQGQAAAAPAPDPAPAPAGRRGGSRHNYSITSN